MRLFNVVAGLFLVTLLAGCAGLTPSYEKPQVNITSVSLAPQSEFATPTFVIGLQVISPNRHDLPLQGMTYSLEVDDHRILSGAKPDLPRIPGYGTAEFTITASPDLLGSARLINEILSSQENAMTYRFKARLDVGSLLPFITIEETGEFGFGAATTESEI